MFRFSISFILFSFVFFQSVFAGFNEGVNLYEQQKYREYAHMSPTTSIQTPVSHSGTVLDVGHQFRNHFIRVEDVVSQRRHEGHHQRALGCLLRGDIGKLPLCATAQVTQPINQFIAHRLPLGVQASRIGPDTVNYSKACKSLWNRSFRFGSGPDPVNFALSNKSIKWTRPR